MSFLRVGDTFVATYVIDPPLDIRLAPRPYLHPVRTLAGTVVTDELCFDHPWHLGASVTIADVNGWNFWGGRTFVRDQGYTWLTDHGTIRHDGWVPASSPGGLSEKLRWCDGDDRTLLTERRSLTAGAAPGGWELSFRYALTTAPGLSVSLGSPATNGRTGEAGYGGFFWRCPGERAVASEPHGSTAESVTLTVDDKYALTFRGLAGKDRWFIRTEGYIGVCAALAWEDPLVVPAGETLSRHIRVLVTDL
ncbi:PmoA family protein [Paractinoplanes lichenicola]|uniref:PmoA family protein n=1 Tax=Paractinoplanes lichenicola TaxID=2802976 RepID=A0ABS1VUR4_9ACTN|nr:PmoA family protein [Actinoplanes lichenicola]MBL7258217.1 PmoA family protein [Actinoplanes lichenicola]